MPGNIPQAAPTPDVAPAPIGTPYNENRATPEEFGSGAGENAQQVSAFEAHIGNQQRLEANAAQVMGARAVAEKAINDMQDPVSGYFATKGDDALAAKEPTLAAFDKTLQTARESLKNPEQIKMWQQHELQMRDQVAHLVNSHEHVEIEAAKMARAEGAIDQATRGLQQPDTIADVKGKKFEDQWATVQNLARGKAFLKFGFNASNDAIQSVVAPELQKAAIDGMQAAIATQNPEIAQHRFDTLSPFLGTHFGVIKRQLETMKGQDMVAQAGMALLEHAKDPVHGGYDATKAGDLLDTLPENETTGAVRTFVQKQLDASDNIRKKGVEQMVDRIYKGGDLGDGLLDVDAATKNDPGAVAWMELHATEKWADLKAKATRDQVKQDRQPTPEERDAMVEAGWEMANFPERYAGMTPQGFQTKWRDRLAPNDYRALGNLWREQLTANNKEVTHLPPLVLDTMTTIGRQAGYFPSGKLPPSKWTAEQRLGWEDMQAELIKEADRFRREHGKPATVEDMKDMAVNHLVSVMTPRTGILGRLFGDNPFIGLGNTKVAPYEDVLREYGEEEAKQRKIVAVPGVPADQVEYISDFLTRQRKQVTGSSILKAYQSGVTSASAAPAAAPAPTTAPEAAPAPSVQAATPVPTPAAPQKGRPFRAGKYWNGEKWE